MFTACLLFVVPSIAGLHLAEADVGEGHLGLLGWDELDNEYDDGQGPNYAGRGPRWITRNLVVGRPIPVCSDDFPNATREAIARWNEALQITAFIMLGGLAACDTSTPKDEFEPGDLVINLIVARGIMDGNDSVSPIDSSIGCPGRFFDMGKWKLTNRACAGFDHMGYNNDGDPFVHSANEELRTYYGRAHVIVNPWLQQYCRDIYPTPAPDPSPPSPPGCTEDPAKRPYNTNLVQDLTHELGHILGLADYYCNHSGVRVWEEAEGDETEGKFVLVEHPDKTTVEDGLTLMNSWNLVPQCAPSDGFPTARDLRDYTAVYTPAAVMDLGTARTEPLYNAFWLTWTQDAVFAESDFEVQRWDGAASGWTGIASIGANAIAVAVGNQPVGSQRYRVVARTHALPDCPPEQEVLLGCTPHGHVHGAASTEVRVPVRPVPLPTPTDARATSPTATTLTLSWIAPADTSLYKLAYTVSADCDAADAVSWFTSSSADVAQGATETTSATVTYEFSSLDPSTTYRLCVRSVQETAPGFEIESDWAEAMGTTTALPQPTNLTVRGVTDSKATLHWSKATGADSYEVQIDGADVEATLGKDATSYEFTLPSADTAYKLGVAAKRGDQLSAFATLTLLKPPSGIEQDTITHNSVKYTWEDGNPTGSATAAEVKIGAAGTKRTADSTEYHTFNNLSASTRYTFYIRLKNDQGPSAWRTKTVTTPARPTCGAQPSQVLSKTETLSPTYAWTVSGSLASYIKTTVTRTQTRTSLGWLGHPTCAWNYSSWGAWVAQTTSEVVRTRTRPNPVVTTEEVGRTTVEGKWWAFGDLPGGLPPDPPGSCYFEYYLQDRYSLAEFTTWWTFNTSRGRWELDASTKRQTGLQSDYIYTWYSTGMRQYCATSEDGVAGASAPTAPPSGTLLPGDYVMAWGGEWFGFTIPSDAQVQWTSRTVGEQEAMVFSLAGGAEVVIIPSQIATNPPTSDNATLSAIVESFRAETDPAKLPASAQQQTCAEAPARDDAGALTLDLNAQWCSVVSSGGELSVRYDEDRISLTIPAERVWLIFAAAQSESAAAAGIWVMERQSKAYLILNPSDGAELNRHTPADAAALHALLDAIAASASTPATE